MTPEELKAKKKALVDQYRKDDLDLDKEYAFSNTDIVIGDFVQDTITFETIKVDKIGVYTSVGSSSLPECTFEGPTFKKDLTPTKKVGRAKTYQSKCTLLKKG